MPDDVDELGKFLFHELEGDALVGLNATEHQSYVLIWKETFRNDRDEISAEAQCCEQAQHDERRPLQRTAQATIIQPERRCEHALAGPVQPAVLLFARVTEHISAHHRRRRQRDAQRNHDRDRQGHRKFAEQPPDNAAHQQDRHKDGDQREAHRQHRKPDLAGALQRRLHSRLARFHVPGDVLKNDDRVIDDEAGRDRQRHQRQVVEAVTDQIHDPERADQRDRHRHARDQASPARCAETRRPREQRG